MKIMELFDGDHGGTANWDSNEEFEQFTVTKKFGNRVIIFAATHDGGGDWEISFEDEDGKVDMTDRGQSYQIIGFVIAALKDFIKQRSPQHMMFTAAVKDKSRIDVYRHLIKRFGKDYITKESTIKENKVFLLSRKEISR